MDRQKLQTWDQLIRTGKSARARKEISAFLAATAVARLGRHETLELARLARRCDRADLCLRLLHPRVRPPARSGAREASASEKTEYAASLLRFGGTSEARTLLASVDAREAPQSQLFLAFAHFSEWNYEAALEPLDRYLASHELSDYERIIGRVNLAAAYAALENASLGLPLIRELQGTTVREGLHLLHGNLYDIEAQLHIDRQDWSSAQEALDAAERFLAGHQGISRLYVDKFRAIAELGRRGPSPERLEALGHVQARARELRDWETLRDCDLFRALHSEEAIRSEIRAQLYFGTPFTSYRERIARYIGVPEGESFEWEPPRASEYRETGAKFVVDSARGTPRHPLKTGQVPQRLLLALTQDLYRPPRLLALFSRLFPERHFNPSSSPHLVFQAMKRLRSWIKSSRAGIEIVEARGDYRIHSTLPVRLLLHESPKFDAITEFVARASTLRVLTPREVSRALSLPYRTAQRLLAQATQRGLLERQGQGRSVQYAVRDPIK